MIHNLQCASLLLIPQINQSFNKKHVHLLVGVGIAVSMLTSRNVTDCISELYVARIKIPSMLESIDIKVSLVGAELLLKSLKDP